MEQNMEEKKVDVTKKTKNKNTGIIVFLILVLICMTGYIIYDKTMSDKCDVKENEKTEEEKFEKLEYLDIYSDQIQKLYNNIQTSGCYENTVEFYRNGSVSMDSFKKNAFYMAYEMLVEEKGTTNSYGYKELKSFTIDEINKKVQQIFGKEFNVEAKAYQICPVYNYDNSTKTYTLDPEGGCGCTTGPDGPHMTLYQATTTGDKISIYESVVYQQYDGESNLYTYYKDPLYNQKINDYSCEQGFSTKKCIDNSTKYKFTFTLEDDNYILTKITKAN